MYYKVKEVSDMVGLSVRMLHHYDKKGLLKPDHLTDAGYRQYSEENLIQLQQILFLRELDFSLDAIKNMMVDSAYDSMEVLDRQQKLLEMKVQRLLKIVDNIEKTKESVKRGGSMSNKERFDGFDMNEIEAHKEKYAKEVKDRWGDTDAYAQSVKRTANYTVDDHERIQKETDALYEALVKLMGSDVSDAAVQVLVAARRQMITDHYYDCTMEIFAGLGQMYVADERFTKNLDKYAAGFAKYLSDAIAYYSVHAIN